MKFVFALGGVQLVDHLLDFIVTDIDHRFDLAAQHPAPRHFGADLGLQAV